MTTPVGLPNYQQLRRTVGGVETVRGTAATVANKWYGAMTLDRRQPLADSDEYAGTFFADYTPVRGAVEVTGTYQQNLAYEDAFLLRYALKGGVTGTDDGNTTHGYEYAFRKTASRDDLDTATVEYGYPGLPYRCAMLMFPEFTISADIDDAQAVWKFNSRVIALSKELITGADDQTATGGSTTTFVKTGAGWTVDQWIGAWAYFKSGTAGNVGLFREVASNTATTLTFVNALPSTVASGDIVDLSGVFTAGITDRTRETVKGPGTKLYLDTTSAIGTTQITGRFLSFSVTHQLNAAPQRFMEDVSQYSTKLDLGMVRVTGQVRLQFDRKREWDNWKNLQAEKIRIKQTGSTIDSTAGTTKSAQIDVFNAQWDSPTEDVRGNTVMVTWQFRGYVDTTEGVPSEVKIKNRLATSLA